MSDDESPRPPDDETPPPDDGHREWMQRWAAGDSRAGDRLTQIYFPVIRRYFRRRMPEAQEDLVQETFLRLAANVAKGSYRGDARVRVYLYGIARNVLFERLHQLNRERSFDPLVSSLHQATGRRLSSLLGERERHQLVLDALEDIPLEQHDLLELRYFHRLTGPELRELLGISEGTVRSRIRAALARLLLAYDARAATPHTLEDIEDILARWLDEFDDDDDT